MPPSSIRGLLSSSLLVLLVIPPLMAQVPRSTDASIGVWPWLVGNVDKYQDEIISRAKATGLDTIYMHVWKTTGSKRGELHIFDEARSWNTANGKLVPQITLGGFVRKAHAAGLQVVGVVQVFGSPSPLPSDYAHQDFLIRSVIRYLVHSYDASGERFYPLDGIALDYIRWFGGNHGSKEVNRFLDEMRKEVGPFPIHAYLIAGAYALDGGSYNNTFRTYSQFLAYVTQNYGQDWQQMAQRCDCLMPMAYTANGHVYGSNLGYMEGYLEIAARYARIAVNVTRSGSRVVPAIRTWNSSGQTTTRATIEACARGAMKGGADGFMAFRYFTARGHNDWFLGLQTYSEPGPDLPIASLAIAALGIQALTNSTACRSVKFASSQLRIAYDLDGDGSFEIQALPLGGRTWTLTRPGPRTVSLELSDPRGHKSLVGIQLKVADILQPSLASLSAAAGGTAPMTLSVGSGLAGSHYILFCSLSGTTPGTPLGGNVHVPLNADALTSVAFALRNVGPFSGFASSISAPGTASPKLQVQPGWIPAAMAGSKLYFAAVGVDAFTGVVLYASNPVELRIVP